MVFDCCGCVVLVLLCLICFWLCWIVWVALSVGCYCLLFTLCLLVVLFTFECVALLVWCCVVYCNSVAYLFCFLLCWVLFIC